MSLHPPSQPTPDNIPWMKEMDGPYIETIHHILTIDESMKLKDSAAKI